MKRDLQQWADRLHRYGPADGTFSEFLAELRAYFDAGGKPLRGDMNDAPLDPLPPEPK